MWKPGFIERFVCNGSNSKRPFFFCPSRGNPICYFNCIGTAKIVVHWKVTIPWDKTCSYSRRKQLRKLLNREIWHKMAAWSQGVVCWYLRHEVCCIICPMHYEGHLSCFCFSNICHCLEFIVLCLSRLYPSLPSSLPRPTSVYVSLHSAQIDGGCWLRAHRARTRSPAGVGCSGVTARVSAWLL